MVISDGKNHQIEGSNSRFYSSSGGLFEGGGFFEGADSRIYCKLFDLTTFAV